MHIVQIVPFLGPGSGVAGVAYNLQEQFRADGHTVEAFTMATAGYRRKRPWPKTPLFRAFALMRRMVWFTTVGTYRAQRFLAARPGAVSICHNNAMVGDVYVNHGVVVAAMRARGRGLWRVLRNPTHPFTFFRDLIRYRSRIHRAVVALSESEADTLRQVYGKVTPRIEVIPNGVDLQRFRPPTPDERAAARATFHLDAEDRVVLFVGHEFRRKGLEHAIAALAHAPTVLLLVVGGSAGIIDEATTQAEQLGVRERVLFVGPRFDLPLFLHAADIFILPSSYEANALVVLEALAAGLPVLATRVGYAPEVIEDGVNGYLIDQDAARIGDRMEELAAAHLEAWAPRARAAAEQHGWAATARAYEALLRELDTGAEGRS